ncbi:MAG: hypothetical protein ACTSPI_00100 [Candidatus Heimdallarchaeaceae archaeon]
MVYPDWKIKLAEDCISSNTESEFEDVNNLISVLTDTCENAEAVKELKKAIEIYKQDQLVKEILEAALICEDFDIDICSMITGVPVLTIRVYSQYFFDLKAFKYKLHKHEYVRTYDNPDFKDAKLYKQWALSVGMDFLRWKFDPINCDVAPRKVISSLMADTYFRAKEHINESITSEISKQSLRWIKHAIDSVGGMKSLEAGDDTGFLNDFRIALEYKEDTKTKDDISDAEIIE